MSTTSTTDAPVHYSRLVAAAPAIAARITERFRDSGIALLGTVRSDGSPRVSPVEVSLLDGDLFVGMMPGSAKQLDVEREPRCALLTPVADRTDLAGEGKLFAVASPVRGERGAALLGRMAEGIDVDPAELAGSPVYEVLVRAAAWQQVEGEEFVTWSWDPGRGVRHRRRVGATAQVVEADPSGGPARPAAAEVATDGDDDGAA